MKKKRTETVASPGDIEPGQKTMFNEVMDSTGVLAHKMASSAGEVIRARDGYANVADAVLPQAVKSTEVAVVKKKRARSPKITKVKQSMFSITVFVNGNASTTFSYSSDATPTITTTVEKL